MTLLINLPAASSITTPDLVYVNQGGISKKATVQKFLDLMLANGLAGSTIELNAAQLTTNCTIFNFIGDVLGITITGNKANITVSANKAIQFKNLASNLGSVGTVNVVDTESGIVLSRNSNTITIGLQQTVITDASAIRAMTSFDAGKYIRFTHSAPIPYTLSAVWTNSIPVGKSITLRQVGTGKVVVTPDVGVVVASYLDQYSTARQHTTIVLTKVDTLYWELSGQVGP